MSILKGQNMNDIAHRLKREEGNVLIVALIFLVILTLIGIFATRTAQMDLQIASNEMPYKRNFYLAEAGLYREAAEIGRGNYPVANINSFDQPLAERVGGEVVLGDPLPGAPHVVKDHVGADQIYDFEVRYEGFFPPPPGYSAIHFVRYDYNVRVDSNRVTVDSRLYRIGPKTE
jgi:hypothetical protein